MCQENAPETMHEIIFWFCWKEFLSENCAEEIVSPIREKEGVLASPVQGGTIVEDSDETPADDLDQRGNQGIFTEKESLKVKTRMPSVLAIVT
jgi:hypothetical protein